MADRIRALTAAQHNAIEAVKRDPRAPIPESVMLDLVALGLVRAYCVSDQDGDSVPMHTVYSTTARAWEPDSYRLAPEAEAVAELWSLVKDAGNLSLDQFDLDRPLSDDDWARIGAIKAWRTVAATLERLAP
jgi:hypothetical protein